MAEAMKIFVVETKLICICVHLVEGLGDGLGGLGQSDLLVGSSWVLYCRLRLLNEGHALVHYLGEGGGGRGEGEGEGGGGGGRRGGGGEGGGGGDGLHGRETHGLSGSKDVLLGTRVLCACCHAPHRTCQHPQGISRVPGSNTSVVVIA